MSPKKRTRIVKKKKTHAKKRVARPRVVTPGPTYAVNKEFAFFNELHALILKPSPAERGELTRRIAALGRVKLAVISGVFLNTPDQSALIDTNSPTDLFLVADDLSKQKLAAFLKSLEAEVGKEIKFGIMDREEFMYRFGMFDRFVRVLLEGPHEKLINKLGI
ncbi:MAG: hypothetical protein QY311_00090 [Candidatus Paceibacterota bacterium]|nr:MAG: hypothetical protein QY311_00090 [Candidatus Paceibacterota bacterium]